MEAVGQGTPERPYGLHWWALPGRPGFYAFGAFGQYAFVLPEHGLAMAITGAVPGSISRPDVGIPPIVWAHLPAILSGADADAGSAAALLERTSALALAIAPPASDTGCADRIDGTRFDALPNEDGIRSITLRFRGAKHCRLAIETVTVVHTIDAGLNGDWIEGETSLPGMGLHHGYEPERLSTVAAAGWTAPQTLTLNCQYVETAFRDRFELTFADDALVFSRSVNVNGGRTTLAPIRALREKTSQST
ncbi:hypothetical protein [Variovorax sp. Sphag1AA]|uniref:hypothetical protein n=1 Tax=Variovorax sp. Sphag1AA TaxID=2587027 RepID=UPI00161FD3E9|nr:hypothetical protein [Variovorax sp. Sphag1AA]MBB3181874.1 hypothetical protein [Variovorax sp. Sphag1AA]